MRWVGEWVSCSPVVISVWYRGSFYQRQLSQIALASPLEQKYNIDRVQGYYRIYLSRNCVGGYQGMEHLVPGCQLPAYSQQV